MIGAISKIKNIFKSIDIQLQTMQNGQTDFNAQLEKLSNENIKLKQLLEEQRIKGLKTDEELFHLSVAFDNQCEAFKMHRQDESNDHWLTKFGYDSLISGLQLAQVEQKVLGNREKLEALKDTHVGETCFVIGNGPSLKAEDLDKLKKANMFCFASKRITKIFDSTDWRPDVWGVSDLDFIKLYHEEMDDLSGFIKVVPCQSILNLNLEIKDAIYFPFIQIERTPSWFNKDVTKGVHFWGTITCKLINFAAYMGFTKIYLLGVDNTIPLTKGEDGKMKYDVSVNSHFSKNYFDKNEDLLMTIKNIDDIQGAMQYISKAYSDVRSHCEELHIQVMNATRGGELEAFERIQFDDIKL